MAIELTDDGTLDTVLRCSECGEEMRYNYDPASLVDDSPEGQQEDEDGYNAFVEWAIEDATDSHECTADSEPTEPEDGDITTSDHETFYQNGKRVLWLTAHGVSDDHDRALEPGDRWVLRLDKGRQITVIASSCEQAVRQYMERTQFWPNVWFISDHGNAHLMDLSEGK